MDSDKKALFVRKMGKKTLKFAKGGHVRRQKYGIGGIISGLMSGGGGDNVASGTNGNQIADSYKQNQAALTGQSDLANTLTPQAASAVSAQNVLSGQYAQQAEGQGPNVAMNVLNQATGQNVNNQAALMAGQRGAGANAGLMARQAAQTGAMAQQQAAGQAATTQAQQQIAAQQAQAQLASNQISQSQGAITANTQAQQGEQGILQGANTANNQVKGQMAQQSQSQGASMLSGLGGGAATIMSGGLMAEGGEVHGHKKLDFVHKMAKMGLEHFSEGGLSVPEVKYQQAQPFQQHQMQDSNYQGINLNEAPAPSKDKKAPVKAPEKPMLAMAPVLEGPAGTSDLSTLGAPTMAAQGGMMGVHKSHVANFLAGGGKVPAMVSPGEIYLRPDQVKQVVSSGANPLQIGEKIPGKAKVKGDSYKNDTVPKDLDEGGVVIDRKNVRDPKKAEKFVHKSIAKKKAGGK